MKITTETIIRTLQVDDAFRDELLKAVNTLDPDRKYELVKLLWDLYYDMFQDRLQHNIDKALADKTTNEELDKEFYKKIKKQTELEMETDTFQQSSTNELSDIRNKLQALISK